MGILRVTLRHVSSARVSSLCGRGTAHCWPVFHGREGPRPRGAGGCPFGLVLQIQAGIHSSVTTFPTSSTHWNHFIHSVIRIGVLKDRDPWESDLPGSRFP